MADLSRRSFFGLGLGAGAAFAASPLLAAAKLDGPVSKADSPLFKTVAFRPLAVKVGAEKPFRAVHCSDSHVAIMSVNDLIGGTDRDERLYLDRLVEMKDGLPTLAACVLKARREKLPLFHTGDLYDYECEATHFIARDAFDGLGRFLYVPGNHEYHGHWGPGITPKEFPAARARLEKDTGIPVSVASLVVNGVNFVSVDNGGLSYGAEREQFAAVKKEFAKGLPVVLLCHFPLVTDTLYRDLLKGDGIAKGHRPVPERTMPYMLWGLRDADKPLVEWLKRQPQLKAVLCGHLHMELTCPVTDALTQYVAGATYHGNAYEIAFS